MKRNFVFTAVALLLMLFFASCRGDDTSCIKSISIQAQNEEIFSSDVAEKTYYYDREKDEKLILNLWTEKKEGSILDILGADKKINWHYTYCKGEKKEVDEWSSQSCQKITTKGESSLIIDISKIDLLGSYTIIAELDGLVSQYEFEIDSLNEIGSSLEFYYVQKIGDEIEPENRIQFPDDTDISLACSTTYAIKSKDLLGVLACENITPESILLNDKSGDVISDSVIGDVVYMTTCDKEGENALLKIKAGNKKNRDYRFTTQSSRMITTALSAPKVRAIPITNGFRLLFCSDNTDLFNSHSLMLKINGGDAIKVIDKYIDENENFTGVYYDMITSGEYSISAYFQREYSRSLAFEDNIIIKDEITDESHSLGNFLKCEDYHQDVSIDEWNKAAKVQRIKITLPAFSDKKEPLPLSITEDYYPYKYAKARITVRADDVQYYDLSLDKDNGTCWYYDITDDLVCDNVEFEAVIYNIQGSFQSLVYHRSVENKKLSATGRFEYYRDDEDSRLGYYKLSLENIRTTPSPTADEQYSSTLPDDCTLYINISEDGGESFGDVQKYHCSQIVDQDNRVYIKKAYLKNSDKVIFRAKLICDGYFSANLGEVSTGKLMVTAPSNVDYSQSVQDAPNIKKAKITAPFMNGYKVEYLINNSSTPAADDDWKIAELKNGTAVIEVIKYEKNSAEQRIDKTLWLRTTDLFDSSLRPAIQSFGISMLRAPKPLENKNDGYLWKNTGFWVNGIAICLHAPEDNCYIRTIAESENAYANGIYHFDKKGDEIQILHDWDQCFAEYRYNRFSIVAYTSMAGYIDSQIDEYCGYERSGRNPDYQTFHTRSQNAIEELKKSWRCTYAF